MKKRVEARIAMGVLEGRGSAGALLPLFSSGLVNLDSLMSIVERVAPDPEGKIVPLRIGTRLPYGARLYLFRSPKQSQRLVIRSKTGVDRAVVMMGNAAHDLATRCAGNTEATLRVMRTIERMRRYCIDLLEVSTRWLPTA